MKNNLSQPISKISFKYNSSSIVNEKRGDPHFFSPIFENIISQIVSLYEEKDDVPTLGDFFYFRTGESSYKNFVEKGKGVPFVRVQNLTPVGLNLENAPELSNVPESSCLKYRDILLTITGATIGKTSINLYNNPLVACGDIAILSAKPNVDVMLLYYLYGYLQTWHMLKLFKRGVFGVSNGHLSISYIEKLPVYIPKEEKLVKTVSDNIKSCLEKRKKALDYIHEINTVIRNNIKIDERPKKVSFSYSLSECLNAKRADPHYFNPYYKYVSSKISSYTGSVKQLKNIVKFVKTSINPKTEPQKIFTYVEIGSISTTYGVIEQPSKIKGAKAPSRARKLLKEGTIILSTTRPYRNAIAIVDSKYNNAVGTTGFAALKPNNDELYYLYCILRSPLGMLQLEQRMSNSNYPAITEEALRDILIPYFSDDDLSTLKSYCLKVFKLLDESILNFSFAINELECALGRGNCE